jgi:ribosomal-protein-alanine N-acetyltransferase
MRTLVRPLTAGDIDTILATAAASPEAAQWTREAYAGLLSDLHRGACLVAEIGGSAVGFICFRIVSDEAEVLNLAVTPAVRRQGVGSLLLDEALREAALQGARRVFLEVRESNQPALEFYRRLGFSVSAHRRGYYADPVEDAVVLMRDLSRELMGDTAGTERPT